MCGIAGFIDFNKKQRESQLQAMTDVLAHRGPDGDGCALWKTPQASIGFGHRRLSIIDLSESGRQPMSKYGLHITFNGEIYNYKEIRKELKAKAYTFLSDSDTEVILSAFDCWGMDAVHKFIGMFAFAIYNEKQEELYLFRDRAGVKPFYYYWKNDLFLFASELKAFHEIPDFEKTLDLKSLAEYFQYGYIPTPKCIFEHCHKLEQGHYLILNLQDQQFTKHKYWDVFDYAKTRKDNITEKESINETERILSSACNYRMVSDVPVGIFLSGGYDSSMVTALIQKESTQKVKTFTIGFEDDDFNEAQHAALVAKHLGTDHQEMTCTMAEAKSIVPLIPDICDEPFGDSSIIPTYLVSKMARHEVTVALSSDGGDEQFIGYNRYLKAIKLSSIVSRFPNLINKGIASIGSSLYSKDRIYQRVWTAFKHSNISTIPAIQTQNLFIPEINQLFNKVDLKEVVKHTSFSSDLNNLFAAEYQKYMQDDIMVKVDRAAMAVSLEGREPLLDHRIAEWALQLPIKLKYKDNTLKYILKTITHKYIPKEIMDRPKQGFAIPVVSWLRADMANFIYHYFDQDRIRKQGIFNYQFIEKHLQQFKYKKAESELFIWHMLVFQMWYDRWMD
jgi:asparagine synthase (glutamine-hydrolysing)